MTDTKDIKGIGPAMARELASRGIKTAKDLAETPAAKLTDVPGIGAATWPAFPSSALRRTAPPAAAG